MAIWLANLGLVWDFLSASVAVLTGLTLTRRYADAAMLIGGSCSYQDRRRLKSNCWPAPAGLCSSWVLAIQPQLPQRPLALGGNRRRGSCLPGRAMGETAVAAAVAPSRSGLGGDWHGRLQGLPGPALAKRRQTAPTCLEWWL